MTSSRAAPDDDGADRSLARRPASIRRLATTAVVVGLGVLASATGYDGQARAGSEGTDDHSAGFAVPDPLDRPVTTPPTTSRATSTTGSTVSPAEAAAGPGPSSTSAPSAPLECLQSSADGPVWRLTFHDDFTGDAVDTDDWDLYNSVGNAGFGLRRPSAIHVEDGQLVLTAQMIDGSLVSGGMAHRVDQVYGRWEFRVRTEADPSEATSGVVLTWPRSGNWPIDGENDMYETERRASRTPFRTYIHYGADNRQEFLTHDADGTEWHDVAMEWTPDRIAMFRDGAYVGEVTNLEAIPDVEHHMTIQLDAWADAMGDPVRMYVDWVRVYRLDDASTC